MTRKDYVLLAEALADARRIALQSENSPENTAAGVVLASLTLAQILQNENPRFDRARFLAACGGNHE